MPLKKNWLRLKQQKRIETNGANGTNVASGTNVANEPGTSEQKEDQTTTHSEVRPRNTSHTDSSCSLKLPEISRKTRVTTIQSDYLPSEKKLTNRFSEASAIIRSRTVSRSRSRSTRNDTDEPRKNHSARSTAFSVSTKASNSLPSFDNISLRNRRMSRVSMRSVKMTVDEGSRNVTGSGPRKKKGVKMTCIPLLSTNMQPATRNTEVDHEYVKFMKGAEQQEYEDKLMKEKREKKKREQASSSGIQFDFSAASDQCPVLASAAMLGAPQRRPSLIEQRLNNLHLKKKKKLSLHDPKFKKK